MKTVNAAKAAAILGCSSTTVRRLVESGKIKGHRVSTPTGVAYEIDRASIDRLRSTPQTGRGYRRGVKRSGPRGTAITK